MASSAALSSRMRTRLGEHRLIISHGFAKPTVARCVGKMARPDALILHTTRASNYMSGTHSHDKSELGSQGWRCRGCAAAERHPHICLSS